MQDVKLNRQCKVYVRSLAINTSNHKQTGCVTKFVPIILDRVPFRKYIKGGGAKFSHEEYVGGKS